MSPQEQLRDIANRLVALALDLRVPSQRGPLNGAWSQTLGGMSDTCEGLANLLEVLGNKEAP